MFFTVLALLLSASVPATEKPTRAYSEREPLPVDATSRITLSAQLGLEMRRAGGPRPATVEVLLRDLGKVEVPSAWCTQVVETCFAGGVEWAVFLPSVDALAGKVGPQSRDYVVGKAGLMRREAYLQGLPLEQRQALYKEAILSGRSITGLGPWLSPAECALRALQDGMNGLIPDIERELAGRLRSNRQSIERALRLRKALIAPDPEGPLLQLIRRGVERDVEHTLLAVDKRTADSRPFEAEIGLARQALEELRRLNPPGAAERLEAMYALYKPAQERVERERAELLAKQKEGKFPPMFPPQEISRAKGVGGQLAVSIVQVIGDLGDRDFERQVFRERLDGLPILWDRVNQVEKELVSQGKMNASEMVTSEQQ
jgi:hypothetical protein